MKISATRLIISASMNDAWLPEGDGAVHIYRKGERMDGGLPDEWLAILKRLGISVLQIDSPFCTVPKEAGEGRWDWPHLNRLMQKCKQHDFKAVFFSRWHWPPYEIEHSTLFTGLAYLEHGKSIPCWSIWNPESLNWVEKCIAALWERYNSSGEAQLNSLYMGVQGDYGETFYPQFSSAADAQHPFQVLEHDRGRGEYHGHSGYPSMPIEVRSREFLLHVTSSHIGRRPSVRNLSQDVDVLASSAAGGAAIWQKRLGSGCSVVFAGDYHHTDLYLELARDCIYNREVLSATMHSALPITDSWDDVFSTLTDDWLFLLNLTDQKATCRYAGRDVIVEPGSLQRIGIRDSENTDV